MYYLSNEALQAEIDYRQDRIKRDFQRPLWFRRRPVERVTPAPCRPVAHARHAM